MPKKILHLGVSKSILRIWCRLTFLLVKIKGKKKGNSNNTGHNNNRLKVSSPFFLKWTLNKKQPIVVESFHFTWVHLAEEKQTNPNQCTSKALSSQLQPPDTDPLIYVGGHLAHTPLFTIMGYDINCFQMQVTGELQNIMCSTRHQSGESCDRQEHAL